MSASIELCGSDDRHVVENLHPLYLHEISEFEDLRPNAHGLLDGGNDVRTLADQVRRLEAWWRNPETLFPYLVRVDGVPAGFNLVAAKAHLPAELDADFVVYGLFVLHVFRGTGAAEAAAVAGFEAHRGRWEVVTYPPHARAIAFWRRVCRSYTGGDFAEAEVDHPWGRKVAFTFDNSR